MSGMTWSQGNDADHPLAPLTVRIRLAISVSFVNVSTTAESSVEAATAPILLRIDRIHSFVTFIP